MHAERTREAAEKNQEKGERGKGKGKAEEKTRARQLQLGEIRVRRRHI